MQVVTVIRVVCGKFKQEKRGLLLLLLFSFKVTILKLNCT